MNTKWLNSHDWNNNVTPADVGWTQADHKRIQDGLNQIVGIEPDGTLRWRLAWGCDGKATEIWDRYRDEWRPRYAWKQVKHWRKTKEGLMEQYHEWVCVPRFFIECMVPNAARDYEAEAAATETENYKHPDGRIEEIVTGHRSARRLVGADYMLLTPIYEHSNLRVEGGWRSCCFDAMRKGSKCFGRFRLPDEKDLEYLREQWAGRVAEHNKPGALTAEDTATIFREMADQKAAERAAKVESDRELRERIRKDYLWARKNTNSGSKLGAFSMPS